MVTQQQFKDHWKKLYDSKAVYVWGANGQTITQELTDKLHATYGSTKYNKAYYDNKCKEGKGRIGADCSGAIYPLSKADTTAKGYYNACPVKGKIKDLPKGTACLVFNAAFTHVGAYMGDGTTIEMKSSAENCVKQNFNQSRWAYYGIPKWLEQPKAAPVPTNNKYSVGQHVEWGTSYKDPTLACGIANAKGGSGHGTIKAIVAGQAKYQMSTGVYCNDGDIKGLYTAPATPAPAAKPATKTINKKEVIKNIQKWCNNKNDADIAVDGDFGPKTKAALCRVLQTYLNKVYGAGLKVDGDFGPKTKAAIKKAVSGKNDMAYVAQAMLFCKGYDMSHSISNNKLDGDWGNGCAATTLDYQQDTRGLTHDGKCGPATFCSLFN